MDFGKIIEPKRIEVQMPKGRRDCLSNLQRKRLLNVVLSISALWHFGILFIRSLGAVHSLSLWMIALAFVLLVQNNARR